MKGKTVFITDVERKFGPSLARAFTENGANVVTGECDLARVDVVVNNVLFPVEPQAFAAVSFDVWKRKIEVELTGSFFLFKSVLPHTLKPKARKPKLPNTIAIPAIPSPPATRSGAPNRDVPPRAKPQMKTAPPTTAPRIKAGSV